MNYKFNIDRENLYLVDEPTLKERTRKRLLQIAELGMEEVGYGQFGYKGVMSGLYIEMVWNYSNEAFADYMKWTSDLIHKKAPSTAIFYRIKPKEIVYHGVKYFMYDSNKDRMVQITVVPAPKKRGRPNVLGIYTIATIGFRANILAWNRVEECTEAEYRKTFDAVVDRLKTIEN